MYSSLYVRDDSGGERKYRMIYYGNKRPILCLIFAIEEKNWLQFDAVFYAGKGQ